VVDVERLESLAQQFAGRVRDDDPDSNQRWLHAQTSAEEREQLLYVLAAAVPVDTEWSVLTRWVQPPPAETCGTIRGPHHHRKAGEPVCPSCKAAAAAHERKLAAARRGRVAA
jgi:hypothetical protein